MRLHLDTTFLIDWEREDVRVQKVVDEILRGDHAVSIDPIVQTEFMAVVRRTRTAIAVLNVVMTLGSRVPISEAASALAATWLGPMDERQRRAHFADALIGAVAVVAKATLVTGDQRLHPRIDVPVLTY